MGSSSDEGSRGKTEEMLLHNQTNFTTIGKYKKGVAKLITLLQKESVFKEMSQDKKFECQKNLFKILNLFDSHGSDLSDDTKIISENEEEEEQAQMAGLNSKNDIKISQLKSKKIPQENSLNSNNASSSIQPSNKIKIPQSKLKNVSQENLSNSNSAPRSAKLNNKSNNIKTPQSKLKKIPQENSNNGTSSVTPTNNIKTSQSKLKKNFARELIKFK